MGSGCSWHPRAQPLSGMRPVIGVTSQVTRSWSPDRVCDRAPDSVKLGEEIGGSRAHDERGIAKIGHLTLGQAKPLPHRLLRPFCALDFWSGAEPDLSADGAGEGTPDYVSGGRRLGNRRRASGNRWHSPSSQSITAHLGVEGWRPLRLDRADPPVSERLRVDLEGEERAASRAALRPFPVLVIPVDVVTPLITVPTAWCSTASAPPSAILEPNAVAGAS